MNLKEKINMKRILSAVRVFLLVFLAVGLNFLSIFQRTGSILFAEQITRKGFLTELNKSGNFFDKMSLWDVASGPHLRGANIIQMRVYPEIDGNEFKGPGPVGPPFIQEDFNVLAELGANYVNISHPGLYTEIAPYVLDLDIQDNLDNLLAKIAQAGLYAVITFRTGPGRNEFAIHPEEAGDWYPESMLINTVWEDQAAQDAWIEMWRYTAQRYRSNPAVVGYVLMCEPNSNEYLDEWDPDNFERDYGGTLYDWNRMYPPLVASIREVDSAMPILVGGMGYSSVEWLPYLETVGDRRIVYTAHQYAPHVYTHQEPPLDYTYPGEFDLDWDGRDEIFNKTWINKLLGIVDDFIETHSVPVAINEFGVVRWEPGAADFMNDEMDLLEQRGLNHALWAWAPSWEPYARKIDAFNFRHGPSPDNHTDVVSSDLMDVIIEFWSRNTQRLSDTSVKKINIRR